MATVAMQQKDKAALDLAVIAFDLSDIMRIDYRDAFGHVGQLAFAAKECGVDLIDRVRALVHEIFTPTHGHAYSSKTSTCRARH